MQFRDRLPLLELLNHTILFSPRSDRFAHDRLAPLHHRKSVAGGSGSVELWHGHEPFERDVGGDLFDKIVLGKDAEKPRRGPRLLAPEVYSVFLFATVRH